MSIIGILLVAIGGIVYLVGGIMILIAAFKESLIWGLGTLIVPFVGLIFVIMHWDRAGKPFLICLAGLVPIILGSFLMPGVSG